MSTITNQPRIPRGVSAGGRFTASSRVEPAVELASAGVRAPYAALPNGVSQESAYGPWLVPTELDGPGNPPLARGEVDALPSEWTAPADELVDQAIDAGLDAETARTRVRALASHVDHERFEQTWADLWQAATWQHRLETDEDGRWDDDPVGFSLIDASQYAGWNEADRSGEDGYGGYDYTRMRADLASAWSQQRRRLLDDLVFADMVAAGRGEQLLRLPRRIRDPRHAPGRSVPVPS